MQLYLIRHTSVDAEGLCYGQIQVPIKDTFDQETIQIKSQLPNQLEPYKVFSSPLHRCKVLAQVLFSEVSYDDRLKEISFGSWEGVRWNDIPKSKIDQWSQNLLEFSPPQGENLIEFANRLSLFLKDQTLENSNTVLVTHSGCIKVLLTLLLNEDLKNYSAHSVDFGSVTKLVYQDQHWVQL